MVRQLFTIAATLTGLLAASGAHAGDLVLTDSTWQQQAKQAWSKRGVYFFDGPQRCPLAGLGTRGAYASNRVAIDDEHSEVTWDPQGRKLVFRNTHSYEDETLVGCVMLLGRGTTEGKQQVPIGVHLHVWKEEDAFEATVHAHVTVREAVPHADFAPIQVVLDNGKERTVALTKSIGLRALRAPFSESTLAKVVGLKGIDNLAGESVDVTQPGVHLADGSVELGHGFVSTLVLRARLISLDGSEQIRPGTPMSRVMTKGAYELRLTCLSSLFPQDKFERDLFLLGLDELPMLQEAKRAGLEDGQTLAFTFRDGQGTIRLDANTQPVEKAEDAVRRYLEFDFLGGIIGHQIELRLTGQLK